MASCAWRCSHMLYWLVNIQLVLAYRYHFYANTDTNGGNILQSGLTNVEDLEKLCDSLGNNCVGFNTAGLLKSNASDTIPSDDVGLFLKTSDYIPPTTPVHIWPLPQSINYQSNVIFLDLPTFEFQTSSNSQILLKAFNRYKNLIFSQHDNMENIETNQNDINITQFTLLVEVTDSTEYLTIDTDESYTLVLSEDGNSKLIAETVFGALRGLESLSQTISFNYDEGVYQMTHLPITIKDYPKFPYRGILIDTSRHYIPLSTMRMVIDSMSYAKLNVLHWHIVDAQSFPLESKKYPDLWKGSWSNRERYTQSSVANLVQYAKERGVRVIPEFDGPGHAWAWGVGYPQLLPDGYQESITCGSTCPMNPCDVPLDPSKNFTFELLDGLFYEVTGGNPGQGLFPDDFLHVGGDEVESGCWSESQDIQDFMNNHNMTDYDELFFYHIQKIHEIAFKYGRTPINWANVFTTFGTRVDKRVIFHVYWAHHELVEVVAAGYRGILSDADDLYLDNWSTSWTVYYEDDPLENITDPEQQKLVLGGESCMWGERMDSSDLFHLLWPKSAALAERLWNYDSSSEKAAIEQALPRLNSFRCLLLSRNIPSAPVFSAFPTQPGSCYFT